MSIYGRLARVDVADHHQRNGGPPVLILIREGNKIEAFATRALRSLIVDVESFEALHRPASAINFEQHTCW